ncbi:MAG: hypothetical protein AAFY71_28230 [Bacteroidota bacterium]
MDQPKGTSETFYHPYLQAAFPKTESCREDMDIKERFQCFKQQFAKHLDDPIYIVGDIEPTYTHLSPLSDSLFIVQNLMDTTYYDEESDDRTYQWFNGVLLDSQENYSLCLILFSFNVGQYFYLMSFDRNGQLISQDTIGGFFSDAQLLSGHMAQRDSAQVLKINYEYIDGYFARKATEKIVKVDSSGRFHTVISPFPSDSLASYTEDWLP